MIPQTLTNMNLFVDGLSFAGRATELTLPTLTRTTDEYRAGGMDAPIEIGLGMALMSASFKMPSIDTDVLKFFGLADDSSCNTTFRGAYKDQKGTVTPVIATLRGMLKELNPGAWTPGQKAEITYSLSCSYYKLEVDGAVVYEIDPLNAVRIINGTDELAAERAALGI